VGRAKKIIMRSRPNYLRFREWLDWAMEDDPYGDDHFFADEVYQDNFLEEQEDIPGTLILSSAALMLEYAHKYFQKHAYTSKTTVFQYGIYDIDGLENYDSRNFERDTSIPNISTRERVMRLYDGMTFENYRSDIWDCEG
jgi:hypothetical protein